MMVIGIDINVMNKNHVRQLGSPLKSIGENSAAKLHINNPIRPLSCISQLIFKLMMLLCVFVMSGCAMWIGYGNEVSEAEARAQAKNTDLFSVAPNESMIVLVHRYFKRCCGASPGVGVKGLVGERVVYIGGLLPLDDFICWRVPAGQYGIMANIRDQQPVSTNVAAQLGKITYLLIDSDLREPPPYELSIEVASKALAEYYGQQTMGRIVREDSNNYEPALLEAIRKVKRQKAEQKLKCTVF